MASNRLPPGLRKPGSVGAAAGPEVAVMAPDGRLLQPGETGEIVIRGPNVTVGLREQSGRQCRGLRAWLVSYRRPGRARRRWLSARHRPAQGDHQPRRREDLAARGRRRADGPSGGRAGRHLRHAARQARRGSRGCDRAARGQAATEGDIREFCRDAACRLQGAAQHRDPGGDPEGRDRQAAAHRPRGQTRPGDDADQHFRRRRDRRLCRGQTCHGRPGRSVDRRARRASRRDQGGRASPDRGRSGNRRLRSGPPRRRRS